MVPYVYKICVLNVCKYVYNYYVYKILKGGFELVPIMPRGLIFRRPVNNIPGIVAGDP